MYVYDKNTGKYLGRAGGPVRDVHTGLPQKMNSKPPRGKGGCFRTVVLVAVLAAALVVLVVLDALPRSV